MHSLKNNNKKQQKKKSLNEKMIKLHDKEKNSKEELHAAEKLLEEGNEKLARALRKRDFSSASVSQSLIETAQKKIKESTERLDRVREEQKSDEWKVGKGRTWRKLFRWIQRKLRNEVNLANKTKFLSLTCMPD